MDPDIIKHTISMRTGQFQMAFRQQVKSLCDNCLHVIIWVCYILITSKNIFNTFNLSSKAGDKFT